jgi:hypothetical protein
LVQPDRTPLAHKDRKASKVFRVQLDRQEPQEPQEAVRQVQQEHRVQLALLVGHKEFKESKASKVCPDRLDQPDRLVQQATLHSCPDRLVPQEPQEAVRQVQQEHRVQLALLVGHKAFREFRVSKE